MKFHRNAKSTVCCSYVGFCLKGWNYGAAGALAGRQAEPPRTECRSVSVVQPDFAAIDRIVDTAIPPRPVLHFGSSKITRTVRSRTSEAYRLGRPMGATSEKPLRETPNGSGRPFNSLNL